MTESEDTRTVAGEGGHAVPRPGPPGSQGPGAGTPGSPRPETGAADEEAAGQGPDPDPEGDHGQEAADVVRLELPARDSTGDPAVDEALTAFDGAQGADLASHVRAAEAVHEALQRRLGDAHS